MLNVTIGFPVFSFSDMRNGEMGSRMQQPKREEEEVLDQGMNILKVYIYT